MAASTEQKLDYLLKKIGYTASKTGLAEDSSLSGTKKAPFAEAIPSPLVTPSTTIWNESALIPTTPPGSDTAQVRVYLAGTSGHRMTVDSTVSGSRAFIAYSTYNDTSSGILGDWIDPQFGDSYIIKVYKGDPNSGGVLLSAAGAGSNDTWFFDYSSGVLNFNGTVIPSGVTDTNIYIVGYRYIGVKGLSTAGINTSATSTFKNLSVTGISTFGDDVNLHGNAGVTSAFWDKSDGSLKFLDNVEAKFGSDSRLQIYSDSLSGSVIKTTAGGLAEVITAAWSVSDGDGSTKRIEANGTDVDLYFSGSKKFSTTGYGVTVLGTTRTQQINVTGVSTFVGDATFSGNVSVGGTLTYEDVTNIDSVGLITARTGIKVLAGGINAVGVVTGTSFDGNLVGNVQGNLTGTVLTAAQTNITSVGTLSALTVSGNINANGNIVGDNATNISGINSVTATTYFGDGSKLSGIVTSTGINTEGTTTLNNLEVTGISTFNGTIDIDSGITVSGVSTISGNVLLDTANSQNIVFSQGGNSIKFGDNTKALFGNSSDLQIYHGVVGVSGTSYIDNNTGALYIRNNVDNDDGGNIIIEAKAGKASAVFQDDEGVRLYYNDAEKIATTGYGVTVNGTTQTQQLNVTGISTFSNGINLSSGQLTVATSIKKASGTLDILADTIELSNADANSTLAQFTNGAAAKLYFNGSNKFETTNTGAVVTGILTATTFSGNISGVGATFTNITGTLQTAAQTNITSVGTLSALTVSGNINANGNIVGDNSTNITGIAGVTATTLSGTLQTAAQPNVTSLGTLTSLNVSGDVSIGGTLTYEDVTNIDSLGIITARSGVRITAGGLTVSGVSTFNDTVHLPANVQLRFDSNNTTDSLRIFDDNGNSRFISDHGIFFGTDSTWAVLNESQTTFKIKAGPNDVLLYHSGSERVATTADGVNVTGDITGTGDLTLTSTDTGSSAAPIINLFRNSASPADADYLGQIKFQGESDTDVQRNYAKITGKILDASNGNEDGIIEFSHIKAGSQTITGRFRSDSLQLLNGTNLSVNGTTTFEDDVTFTGANYGASWDKSDDELIFNDGAKAVFGTDKDLVIRHAASQNRIISQNGATLYLKYNQSSTLEDMAVFKPNGAVELYYDNVEKFQTLGVGVTIFGNTETQTLNVTGISTFAGNLNANGNIVGDNATNISGINSVTATSFFGSGAGLTNLAPSGAIEGLTVKDQSGSVVGTAGSISTLDFNGSNGVTITATSGVAGIATIAITGFSTSVGTFNASSGVATIDSFAHATEDYKVAEYTLHFTNGSDIQAQKLLVMQDGTTAYSQEFAVMSSGSQLVSLDATISGANVLVRATPESGISGTTTFRWRRIVQE